VPGVFKQPNELLPEFGLSIDDKDIRHIELTMQAEPSFRLVLIRLPASTDAFWNS
jgi:hypothetical protein